jgi:outer membrane protein assembly factor BamB
VAYLWNGAEWTITVKPRPAEIDDWSHYLYDSTGIAISHDTIVGPPKHYQWIGSPKWSRHHDRMSSFNAGVSANGRLFYMMDEGSRNSILLPPKWMLIARDAFNGTVLWKRPVASWHPQLWKLKSGPAQLPRRVVAVGDTVYATLAYDAPVTALDAATGAARRTYAGTSATEEIIFADGTLYLLVDPAKRDWPGWDAAYNVTLRDNWPWDDHERMIMAIDAASGTEKWRKTTHVVPLSLAADESGVAFHDGDKVIKLNLADGTELWQSPPVARMSPIPSNFGITLIAYQDTILLTGGSSYNLVSLNSTNGAILWEGNHEDSAYKSPYNLYVKDDLVWTDASGTSSSEVTSRNRLTGELVDTFNPGMNLDYFHHRCHRSKSTERYFLQSRIGIEFIDTETRLGQAHNWVRGACLYGVLPANGLIYAPPHNCACYLEAKLSGLNALAPLNPDSQYLTVTPEEQRRQPGPAYGSPAGIPASADEWPTYRHDRSRSGRTPFEIPPVLAQAWKTEIGGKLSAVTVADGRLFVAAVDTHTVWALDAELGGKLWSYTAGGRVDSPPTVYQGRVIFGSADGWVYCLRASDGELIWRYQAAPVNRRLQSYEQIESVWPVHGSVLVLNDKVYCISGRSMYLDGGMRMLQLDPATGAKLSEEIYDDTDPATGQDLQTLVKRLQMPVALPDILSSDDQYIYMHSQRFDLDGVRQQIAPNTENTKTQASAQYQYGEGTHLFTPTGFLDDTWMHRTYWVWGKAWSSGWDGYYEAGQETPSGKILVFDDDRVYGFGRKPKYYKWTVPIEHHLWSSSKEFSGSTNDFKIVHTWSDDLPMFVRAMVMAKDLLFIAGPSDVVNEDTSDNVDFNNPLVQADLSHQDAIWSGAEGGMLRAVNAITGQTVLEYDLDSPPVWDGMAAARGSIYLSTIDGGIICMRAKGLIEVGANSKDEPPVAQNTEAGQPGLAPL